jgi:hypothetical protein
MKNEGIPSTGASICESWEGDAKDIRRNTIAIQLSFQEKTW